jgi:DNA-binding CsgD family transcriptional regulator
MENKVVELRVGQRLNLKYKGREFEAIIINPHAFGPNKPSIGLSFRMGERCAGITHQTLAEWLRNTRNENPDNFSDSDTVQYFELPHNKNQFAIYRLPFDESDYKLGRGNLVNDYHKVIEASEFIDLCFEALTYSKLSAGTREKLKNFLKWFVVEGFYAQAYTVIRGAYTRADSEQLHQWLEARLRNKPERLPYARFVIELHENPAYWTNYTYLNLFGKIGSEMRKEWERIKGSPHIARNYIPEAMGLEAVGFVERMASDLYTGNLEEAHDIAIRIARQRFKLPKPEEVNLEKLFSTKTQKLTPQQVKEIRELYESGDYTFKDIAEAYGVTPVAVSYHCTDIKHTA